MKYPNILSQNLNGGITEVEPNQVSSNSVEYVLVRMLLEYIFCKDMS